jgi:hypothetical protein
MQMIAGQNVSPNSMPGPTGFGFGSGHNPNAAAVMMNNSGVAPTTSKTRPTLTHVDLRYRLMADCGLTPRLSGRTEAQQARFAVITLHAHRAPFYLNLHGPLQAVVRGTAVTAKRSHPTLLALPHRAHARNSATKRRALTEAAEADPTASVAARHRCDSRHGWH